MEEDNLETVSTLRRFFNKLSVEDMSIRKTAALEIYEKIKKDHLKISQSVSQAALLEFHKHLCQHFSDSSEKVREYCIKSLTELLYKSQDIRPFVPYIITVLEERSNSNDLEGIKNLPEVMRPSPSQKPHMLIALVEKSEEVRLELLELINALITIDCKDYILRDFLTEITDILRALAMDPCLSVQVKACKIISTYALNYREMLLHFSEILARSILLPLISKKSQIRLAALNALSEILYCGVYKYNAIIMEILIGFRDPNSVPIKDFYDPSFNINYFALLITDPKPKVREQFVVTVGDWMINLPDRYDHEARLLPYLLSGLFDDIPSIVEEALDRLNQLGILVEQEKEKDFREIKQFGWDSEWTYNSKLSNLKLPAPFKERPRLGIRTFVRNHMKKYVKAIEREIKDSSPFSRYKSSCMLFCLIVYSEEVTTQCIDQIIPNIISSLTMTAKVKEDEKVRENLQNCLFLIGRYCKHSSFFPLISSAINMEFRENEDYFGESLFALQMIYKGYIEAIPENNGLDYKLEFVEEVIKLMAHDQILNSIWVKNASKAENLITTICSLVIEKSNQKELIFLLKKYLTNLFQILLSVSCINIFANCQRMLVPEDIARMIDDGHEISKHASFKIYLRLKDAAKSLNIYEHYSAIVEKIEKTEFGIESWQMKLLFSLFIMEFNVASGVIDINILKNCKNFIIEKSKSISYYPFMLNLSIILLENILNETFMNQSNYKVESAELLIETILQIFINTLALIPKGQWEEKERNILLKYLFSILSKSFLKRLTAHLHVKYKTEILNYIKYFSLMTNLLIFLVKSDFKHKISAENKQESLKILTPLFHVIAEDLKIYHLMYVSEKEGYLLNNVYEFALDCLESTTSANTLYFGIVVNLIESLTKSLPAQYKRTFIEWQQVPSYANMMAHFERLLIVYINETDQDSKKKLQLLLKSIYTAFPLNFAILQGQYDSRKLVKRVEAMKKIAS